jgi:hypothetical protein
MTDTIQDTQVHDIEAPVAARPGGSRSRLPLVVALGGAAVVVAAAAIAFWPSSTTTQPAPPTGFASGTTVDLVLSCSGPDAPCAGGVTAPDGTQWYWSTDVGQEIPSTWESNQVSGSVVTDGEFGTVTFSAGGQSLALLGGMVTPEHSFYG